LLDSSSEFVVAVPAEARIVLLAGKAGLATTKKILKREI